MDAYQLESGENNVTVQMPIFREVFCNAKPEVCSEKAITEGDFAWLFHRYWNGNEVDVNSNKQELSNPIRYEKQVDLWERLGIDAPIRAKIAKILWGTHL